MLLDKIIKISDLVTKVWVAVTLSAMFLVIVVEIFLRESINYPLTWHLEVSQYCLINVTYVGAAIAFRLRQHISINILTSTLPKKAEKSVDLIGSCFLIPFFALLVYSGYQILHKSRGVTPSLHLPIYFYYLPIFIGSIFLLIYSVARIIEDIRENSDGKYSSESPQIKAQ
jgi:TRAP-type C4-dicarboxylate transport system permease small subunit